MTIDFSKAHSLERSASNEFETKVLSFISEWKTTSKTVKIQTSGSTGKPKIFDVEKQKMLNSATMTCNFLELKRGNSALLCLPIDFISGKMMVVRSIERHMKLHISDPTLEPLKNLEMEIDFCAMTPLQVERSLAKIHRIKNLIIGGAQVSENLKKKIIQTLESTPYPTKIFETYGMSETLSHIALKPIFPKNEDWFTTFDGIEIGLDSRNCLRISAPLLHSELLQTNDLVEIRNNNQFRFLGRLDNIINSGGIKIFPETLENIVKKHIPNEAVFIGLPDDVFSQKLVLVIEDSEIERQDSNLRTENLKSIIHNISFEKPYHKPKDIIFIQKIPRTENGKVNRITLLEQIIENI